MRWFGIGITAGVPDIPNVTTQNSQASIQVRPVDELAGLALVEPEPAQFLRPVRSLACLVRRPVMVVPFTRGRTLPSHASAIATMTGKER